MLCVCVCVCVCVCYEKKKSVCVFVYMCVCVPPSSPLRLGATGPSFFVGVLVLVGTGATYAGVGAGLGFDLKMEPNMDLLWFFRLFLLVACGVGSDACCSGTVVVPSAACSTLL